MHVLVTGDAQKRIETDFKNQFIFVSFCEF